MPDRSRGFLAACLLLAAAPVTAAETCANELFRLDTRFEGGRIDDCRFRGNDSVVLTMRSEDETVEDAFSWFAFRVRSDAPRQFEVRLRFPDAYARFWPKISDDGDNWAPAADDVVKRSWRGKAMTLTVTADADGTWVAAQELLTLPWYYRWISELDAAPDLDTRVIGKSVEDRPIHVATSAQRPEAILLIGRQHPAEVPGALAMRYFVDTVMADSELARAFRERFMLVILPLLNPDAVVNGHARHNSGAIDLNRDWGPFSQPETRSVAGLLEELEAAGIRPRLMLDFHATKVTPTMVFYTQLPADNTDPALFATHWLTRVGKRIPEYDFKHDPRAVIDQANTKNYFYRRYGIPAITYEIGDEADREMVHRYTPVFAEEMMHVMLESK